MIVFLVGGESRLMDDLITKMEKEGHKTYLLTGKRDRRGKYRRVFERYDFPYDSESVQEIFSNVNPDLVLFLGAYDTNYDWSDARKESVRYTADLTNILSAYALIICVTAILKIINFVRNGVSEHPFMKWLLSVPIVEKIIHEKNSEQK